MATPIEDFFRIILDYCGLFIVLACISIELILAGIETYLMTLNITRMRELFPVGHAPSAGYEIDGTSTECGYTSRTTSPKHLGGIYFACFFQVSIVLWLVVLAAADTLVFRDGWFKRNAERIVHGMWLKGVAKGEAQDGEEPLAPYYLAALMFLKWFVGVCYMSQSFVAVPHRVNNGPDTNTFVLFMGWALLVSGLPGMFGHLFWLTNTMQRRADARAAANGGAGED